MTTFKFNALALAAHQALKPTAPPPNAEANAEQSQTAMTQMAQALAIGEIEACEAHEQEPEIVIPSAPRAVEVPAAMVNAGESLINESLQDRRLAILVGSRIRAAREANGIGQGELAKAIGHAKQTQQSLWESGKRMVPMVELPGLAKALDTSTDFLLGLTDDMDADPSAARRGLLVQHLRDQLEAVAGSLADVALESGSELEGALRASKLLTRCEEVRVALDRFRAANESRFDDMRGGAWLERTTRELMEAATAVGSELDGVGQRRERAARKAKTAIAAGVH